MNRKKLQETLATLHETLGSADKVDDQTRAMLTSLAQDIQRLSEQDAAKSAAEVEPLSEQLNDAVLKFETDYPQLSRAINQVSVALANLGI